MIDKEKIRELSALMADEFNREGFEADLRDALDCISLTQYETKEVPVGLSDEQINAFACYYGLSTTEQCKLRCELKKWQKTQTFSQSQQFQPDWDDAPSKTKFIRLMVNYLDGDRTLILGSCISEFERPKQTPQVEVGQVWIYTQNSDKYHVDSIGQMKNDCDAIHWIKCVTYRSLHDGGFYTRTLSDFLAKFEQVQ